MYPLSIQLYLKTLSMRFPRQTLLAMMLNETGFNRCINKGTTKLCLVVFCIIGFMHIVTSVDSSCLDVECESEVQQLLMHEKRMNFKQREYDLIQQQKELQLQLVKLQLEQQKLESEANDDPNSKQSTQSEFEYEIPSYCANCLGDTFELSTKSSLSSEYSRKIVDEQSSSSQQMPQLSDHGRLEAIKFQILLKLGLKNKPNVTNTLPKQFIFDTLRRSGDPAVNSYDYAMLFQSNDHKDTRDSLLDQLQQLKAVNGSAGDDLRAEELKEPQPEEEQDFDDFYGRTREIITFAEKGQSL